MTHATPHPSPALLARLATPCLAGSWGPGDGSSSFHAEPGQATLRLRGISLTRLVAAINLYDWGLSMHIGRDDAVTFVTRDGQPACFSGDVTLGDEVLKFFRIERIELV